MKLLDRDEVEDEVEDQVPLAVLYQVRSFTLYLFFSFVHVIHEID